MSNDPVSKIITATVDGFVKDGKMFSAYDVTLKIRKMGVYCKHHAVKADIHSAMADVMNEGSEDYDKTLVNTGTYRTYVYHKSGEDAHKYNASDDAVAPAPVAPKTTKVLISGQNASRDGRGRVCLPASMLRSIGATKGEKVVISPMNGEVVVSSYNPSNSITKDSHVYKVDRDNNVRISAGVLAKAKLGVQNGFAVEQTKNSIRVF